MNHEKIREQVHAGIDRHCASLSSDPYRVQRVIRAARPEGGKTVNKRFPQFAVVLLVLLVLGLSTALAAGAILWSGGLEEMLHVEDDVKEWYPPLLDSPGVSLTQDDVTITLEESMVDAGAAYFAFRVKGYQPPEGQQPAFASTTCRLGDDPEIIQSNASFFKGLVHNKDGQATFLDGSIPEDYSAIPYTDENGELVYIVSMFTGSSLFDDAADPSGKTMTITLTDLGVYADEHGKHEVHVPGTWTFEWPLEGTSFSWTFYGLKKPIGTSGATLTAVRLSPIHIQMELDVAPSLREYEAHEDGDSLIPYFYGVRMKDGTQYDLIAEAGTEGYTSFDPEEHAYQMLHMLNRVIDPSEVHAILFSCPTETGEREIVEVRHNSLY